MLIAGIDPGVNGAIAVLDSENPDSVALLDLKKKSITDIWKWLQALKRTQWYDWDLKIDAKIIIWVEDIHSMYGMSAKSNFSFGKNLGIVTAIAEIFTELPPNTVTPKI